MKYRREVDGLRAVAVIPVILFHAGFDAFSGGFVGVDVFFVISGYLITGIISAELAQGKFSLVGFYERRARRILPALTVVVAACIPLSWLLLAPSDLKDFWQSVVAVSLFASNILFWLESDYFDAAAELKPLLHTWSLAVEEQFYLFFPLLLALVWPLGARRVVAVLLGAGVASFALAQWTTENHPAASFYLLPTRAWELLIGALVALRFTTASMPERVPPAARSALGIAGLALILGSVAGYDEHTPFPSVYTLTPTVGTALILLYGTAGTWVARALSGRVIVGIGLVSYSAYLWHQPAFARHASVGEPPGWVYLLLSVASLVLAVLTWRYVEQPFRYGRSFARPRVFALAAASAAVLAGIGLWGSVGRGLEGRPMSEAQRRVLATAQASPKRNECHTEGPDYRKPQAACELHASPSSWAVFGDSHAVELAYGLADALEASGVRSGVRQFSFSGCAPSYGRANTDSHCARWTKEAVEFIASDKSIDSVVVTYRIHAHLFGSHEGVYPRQPSMGNDAQRAEVWDSYLGVLKRFVAAGKHVTLVLQAPELPRPVSNLVLRHSRPARVPGVDVAWWNERSAFVRARLQEVPPAVDIVDPAAMFCDVRYCFAVQDGTAHYFDDDHMSVAGTRVVAAEVLRRAAERARAGGR